MATKNSARDLLTTVYHRNGYLRLPDLERREREKASYKKGWEVRLVAKDETELQEIRQAVDALDFKLAKPFPKATQWIQPIYGYDAVHEFCELVGCDKLK